MKNFVFCDMDLNSYEKTILSLALSFSLSRSYDLKEDDIVGLANLLHIDFDLLFKALTVTAEIAPSTTVVFGNDTIKGSELMDSTLFSALIKINFAKKFLSQLEFGSSHTDLKNNIDLFYSAIHEFEMVNASIATFECMAHGVFSLDYSLFDTPDFNPRELLDTLKLYMSSYDSMQLNISPSLLICYVLEYDLHVRLNSLHLITVVQIIKHSLFFSQGTRNIADELYDHLLFMLKNGRIISIQTNSLYVTGAESPEKRGKSNNTTRMQIVYGYSNYDTYLLRLDLSHKGEGVIHWNNRTPGGVKCCLFSNDDFEQIVTVNPGIAPCFIEYGRKWALKERNNCNISKELWNVYDTIRSKKEHEPVFQNYNESDVIDFVELISKMFPEQWHVPIDKDEVHARQCFNMDKIMSFVHLLCFEYMHTPFDSGCINKLHNIIVDKAVKYGLINPEVRSKYLQLEGICIIIQLAQEQTNYYGP